jgi:hypothetical protein
MKCYSRFTNGIYLLTCWEEDGHKGDHRDEGGETWSWDEGQFDHFGEVWREVSECHPPIKPREIPERRDVYIPATVSQESIEASKAQPGDVTTFEELAKGCFNCRQGRHEKCAFGPSYCSCKKTNHKGEA